MIGPLIVLVAHGLDLMTLGWALQRYPFSGEVMPAATFIYATAGIAGIVAVKAAGGATLAVIVHSRRSWSSDGQRRLGTAVLLFASAAGIIGAAANLTALAL